MYCSLPYFTFYTILHTVFLQIGLEALRTRTPKQIRQMQRVVKMCLLAMCARNPVFVHFYIICGPLVYLFYIF